MTPARRPWREWLTPQEFGRLFPGGDADYDVFCERAERQGGDPDYAGYSGIWELRQAARVREGRVTARGEAP